MDARQGRDAGPARSATARSRQRRESPDFEGKGSPRQSERARTPPRTGHGHPKLRQPRDDVLETGDRPAGRQEELPLAEPPVTEDRLALQQVTPHGSQSRLRLF